MAETLLSPSKILLYGREMADIIIDQAYKDNNAYEQEVKGQNKFLAKQFSQLITPNTNPAKPPIPTNPDLRLARIYAFSFEGHYFDLAKPAIFVVHGDGAAAEDSHVDKKQPRGPDSADKTGVATEGYSFSHDMRVWEYEKSDLSLRLDTFSGTFEQILLEAEIRPDRSASYVSGFDARVSGFDARVSGFDARVSGFDARGRGRRD